MLFVLPVVDRAAFRAAFHAKPLKPGPREGDDVMAGYPCATIIGRLACARDIADVDDAAARHSSPVTYGGEHLFADDTGDVEIFATPDAPNVAEMARDAKDYGKLEGVASAIKLRDDGATLHVHAQFGDLRSEGAAAAFTGSAPPKGRVAPFGAPTTLRVHVDVVDAMSKTESLEDDDRHELVEQLTGDVEVATSGRGLFGAWAAFDLRAPARVEAYVKKKCKDAGSFKVGAGLRGITLTEHGCAAIFDSKVARLPVALEPIPVSAEVRGATLVVSVGGGAAGADALRTAAVVAPDTDASFAVADQEAVVAFTKSPWIGPNIGAGDALQHMFWFITQRDGADIDRLNDVAAHVAQEFFAMRVVDGGVVVDTGFVTFAHDPPEARAAYDAALASRARADVADYRARMAEIEGRFPGSLVAQRAAEVRTEQPFVGAGLVSIGIAGAWFRRAKPSTVARMAR